MRGTTHSGPARRCRSQQRFLVAGTAVRSPRGLCRQASRSFAAVLRMMPIADHGLTFVDCRNVISTVSFVGHSVSGTVFSTQNGRGQACGPQTHMYRGTNRVEEVVP